MNRITRRRFLRTSFLAAAALKAWPVVAQSSTQSRVSGANDDIRCAVVGFNSRGGEHISGVLKAKGVRLVALCDVDTAVLNKHVSKVRNDGVPVEAYTDIRKLLENPDIDA